MKYRFVVTRNNLLYYRADTLQAAKQKIADTLDEGVFVIYEAVHVTKKNKA